VAASQQGLPYLQSALVPPCLLATRFVLRCGNARLSGHAQSVTIGNRPGRGVGRSWPLPIPVDGPLSGARRPGPRGSMREESVLTNHTLVAKPRAAKATIRATTPIKVSEVTLHRLTDVFKLLADKSRLKIVLALAQDGELHVSALCDLLDQSQPAVSH